MAWHHVRSIILILIALICFGAAVVYNLVPCDGGQLACPAHGQALLLMALCLLLVSISLALWINDRCVASTRACCVQICPRCIGAAGSEAGGPVRPAFAAPIDDGSSFGGGGGGLAAAAAGGGEADAWGAPVP